MHARDGRTAERPRWPDSCSSVSGDPGAVHGTRRRSRWRADRLPSDCGRKALSSSRLSARLGGAAGLHSDSRAIALASGDRGATRGAATIAAMGMGSPLFRAATACVVVAALWACGGDDAESSSTSSASSAGGGPYGKCLPYCGPAPSSFRCASGPSCDCGRIYCKDPRPFVDTGGPCVLPPDGGNPCDDFNFCSRPGCGAEGICAPVYVFGIEHPEKAPLCGCDDVTYYGPAIASKHRMSIRHEGACEAGIECGDGLQCPSGTSCSREVNGPDECASAAPLARGTCWQLPDTWCSTDDVFTHDHPNVRTCGESTCIRTCDAIRKGKPWYADAGCP